LREKEPPVDWSAFATQLRDILNNCRIRQSELSQRCRAANLPVFGSEFGLSRLLSLEDPGGATAPPTRATLLTLFKVLSDMDSSGHFNEERANGLLVARQIRSLEADEMARIFSSGQDSNPAADKTRLVEWFGTAWSELPHPRTITSFRFVIVSGPSGAGKDTLIRRLKERDDSLHVLKKRATREPWPSEPSYFEYTPEHEFEDRVARGRIIFPYKKRGVRYGFSREELFNHITSGDCVVAVFTEFELVPRVVREMNRAGLPAKAFFIEAPAREMKARNEQRNFDDDELKRREASIDRDILEMRRRRAVFSKQYTCIRYGSRNTLHTAVNGMHQAITEFRSERLSRAQLRALADAIPE
jgi:guanylate kinase